MKPSITVDERGIILHLLNDAGEGVAVPLNASTVADSQAALARAKEKLKTPEGKSQVAKALGSLFWQLVGESKGEDGSAKTDG